jgi:hypothetical protein
MRRFFVQRINPKRRHTFTNVGVGLLPEIKVHLFGGNLLEHLRPTLGANQKPTTYAKNRYTPTIAKRVGLKQVSNYFFNVFIHQSTKRPTPTLINAKQNTLLERVS